MHTYVCLFFYFIFIVVVVAVVIIAVVVFAALFIEVYCCYCYFAHFLIFDDVVFCSVL